MVNEMDFTQAERSVTDGGKSAVSCGHVVTLDGSGLLRPQRLTGLNLVIVAGILVVAAIIGYVMYSFAMNNLVYANERQQEAVAAQIARGESVNLPELALLVGYDNAGIASNLESAGYVMFENTVADGTSLEVVKVPNDLTAEQGAEIYRKGLSKVDASTAAKLLTGMWRLTVNCDANSGAISLRFADFNSGSAAAAITAAMIAEGLTEDSVTESGIDESGNTYKVGTVQVNGIAVTWRVSACALKEVYNVNALPSSAMYVGMRFSY